ncbi:MAG: hypothetical protein AAFX40_04790 [Cyanobacteria bacterium J06639_1]
MPHPMLPERFAIACQTLRAHLSPLCASEIDPPEIEPPEIEPDVAARLVTNLSGILTPEAIATFSSGDLGAELRPYSVEVHKELRLMQMDVARWRAARQEATRRSRLAEIQTRSDRLVNYLDALLQSGASPESPSADKD